MNGIITVWVITWRVVWPAMLAATLLPVAAIVARRRIAVPPNAAFLLPVLGPLLIVIWSGLFWAAEQRPTAAVHWASTILFALVLVSLAVIIWIAVRYRSAPRYWTVIVAGLANFVFALAAGFTGSMAISNTWL